MGAMQALLVEDDATFALLARHVLEGEGFTVHGVATVAEALASTRDARYDCIILDLGLPDANGLTVVEKLRRDGQSTPVMVLTGTLDRESTVRLLDAGADDYVTKPVDVDELRARIRALVRRGGAKPADQLACGNLLLNRLSRQLFVNGKEVALTAKELPLLEHLLINAGTVISRTELLSRVWAMDFDPGSNVVDVNVARIRRKLASAGADVVISSRRGLGFVLHQDGAASA